MKSCFEVTSDTLNIIEKWIFDATPQAVGLSLSSDILGFHHHYHFIITIIIITTCTTLWTMGLSLSSGIWRNSATLKALFPSESSLRKRFSSRDTFWIFFLWKSRVFFRIGCLGNNLLRGKSIDSFNREWVFGAHPEIWSTNQILCSFYLLRL